MTFIYYLKQEEKIGAGKNATKVAPKRKMNAAKEVDYFVASYVNSLECLIKNFVILFQAKDDHPEDNEKTKPTAPKKGKKVASKKQFLR